MQVRMSVWGEPDHQLLASLETWLRLEPQLRAAPLRREPGDRPEADLTIVLPDDRTHEVLAGALSTWLSTRIGDVRLQVTGPDGTVQVSVANIADHPSLLRAALG